MSNGASRELQSGYGNSGLLDFEGGLKDPLREG